jgi:type IV pilus assembly protein PilY1
MTHSKRRFPRPALATLTALLCAAGQATTPLADKPIFSSVSVPGNLALTVSVEFPTAISVAHPDRTYSSSKEYIGYFDPLKCYDYESSDQYFVPKGTTKTRECNGKWSGNFLNWATMQTIDPFRSALTGGYRVIDEEKRTVLEKAWGSNQGSNSNFPDSSIDSAAVVSGATPFSASKFRVGIRTYGNKMRFILGSGGNLSNQPEAYDSKKPISADKTYDLFVRVSVCDSSSNSGGVEANCVKYPSGYYKPVGLLQNYSDRIRYSIFGYLNQSGNQRDGGVLRAQQKFIGPTQPVPAALPKPSERREWDPATGIIAPNPDDGDAADTATNFTTTVSNSGVLNYLNKFGQIYPGDYKSNDPVGELYYAAIRYYKNQGNVAAWSNISKGDPKTKQYVDGFPVITKWNDPIEWYCQQNFILGIGDVNTHADRNLPGATGASEPTKPPEVDADTTKSVVFTDKVGVLHGLGSGLGSIQNYNGCCSNNGALMAGLAYHANTEDIRPEENKMPGRQSIQTFWLDVLEYQQYKKNNQFYLAAKYGGFTVPDKFDPLAVSTDIPAALWNTTKDTVGSGSNSQPRPDNYFTTQEAGQMVAGLNRVFKGIGEKLAANSSSFSTALPQVALSGSASYATLYDSGSWTGDLEGSSVEYDAKTGVPSTTKAWSFSAWLETNSKGKGWLENRKVVSFDPKAAKGVRFTTDTTGGLSTVQLALLDTAYASGDDSSDYLAYLRGDRTNEEGGKGTKAYRARVGLVGDVVNSGPRAVTAPSFMYSDATNPGYGAFKDKYKDRKTIVYFGTNQGMLHAVRGSVKSGEGGGEELFAYVPSALFQGPTKTPAVNGLQALGKPEFVHYNFVNALPVQADVDFGNTLGGSGKADWRTILVGGLGKGGRSYYALDVTDPSAMTSEEAVASKVVLWEFTLDNEMGYSYGEPTIVKTEKYGWVVILTSGHNNSDGQGYIFLVNPRNGELLEKISTGAVDEGVQAGLTALQAFIPDVTDGTADALYAGDLLGNVWRVDVTGKPTKYSAPKRIATVVGSDGKALPITARPLVVIQPGSLTRWVTFGTGKLLGTPDLTDTQAQRFFAVIDGVNAKFFADNPPGFKYPITVKNLKQLTNINQKIKLDLSTEIGWFIDLGTAGVGTGWRVIYDSVSYDGIIAFSAMVPSSQNACKPAGTSRIFALDLGTGSTRISTETGYQEVAEGVAVEMSIRSVAGKPKGYYGTSTGQRGTFGQFGLGSIPRRLNWREVTTGR